MVISNVGIRCPSSGEIELDGNRDMRVVELDEFPYVPRDYPLPSAFSSASGFLYMLMSLRDKRCTYIGQTTNLRKRLQEHNQGMKAGVADVTKRPWVPLIFFSGFDNNHERRRLETLWQHRRDSLSSSGSGRVVSIMRIGVDMCKNVGGSRIILHKCYVMKDSHGDPLSGF